MEDSSAANGGSGRKVWGFLLAIVLLVAVGLVVGIVLVKLNGDGGAGGQDEEEEVVDMAAVAKSTNEALRTCYEIQKSFSSGEITFNESQKRFTNDFESSEGDNVYKIYLAACYADFAYKHTKDIDLAVGIMNKAKPLVGDNGSVARSYYAALRNLYYDAGDNEKVDEISEILNGIEVPDEEDLIIEDDEE